MLRTSPTLFLEGKREMRTTRLSVVLCQQLWGCRGAGRRDRMGCADTRQTHATWGCRGCGSGPFFLAAKVPCQAGGDPEQRNGRGGCRGTPGLLNPRLCHAPQERDQHRPLAVPGKETQTIPAVLAVPQPLLLAIC